MQINNRITQSIIVGLATLVSTGTWVGLRGFFSGNGNWLWPLIGFFILLIFISLNWILAKSKAILLVTLGFVLVSFFFSFGLNLEYFASLSIALALLAWGSSKALDEKKNNLKIKVNKILHQGLPLVMTGLALVIATAYYFSPMALGKQENIKIPHPLFNIMIEPILEDEALQETAYQTVNQIISQQSQAYQEYIPLGISISVFFALKVLSIPFIWLIAFLNLIIFKILVALGAIKIHEKAVLKEVIEL